MGKWLSGCPTALAIGPFAFGVALLLLRFFPWVGAMGGTYGGGPGSAGGGEANPCVGGGD